MKESEIGKPAHMTSAQWQWQALCKKLGEKQAKNEAVRQLRLVADTIEKSPNVPDIYSAELPAPIGTDELFPNNKFITHINVVISYYWPG
jgi:hypothetical protein